MVKVSVIVPVCNVEQYLKKCIDSITAQTLEDIEIICVDDGSTDFSGNILDECASGDSRIVVIHKANAGYGAAINTGMDAASGEYIGIVESDDCILPNMFERLYEVANSNDLDLVKADAFYWLEKYDYTNRIHIKGLDDYYDRVLTGEDREIFYKFYMNTWTGIYRREFLYRNNIRHHESPGASYQDNGFWMLTLGLCERAMWLNDAFYLYRQDNPMASVKNPGKVYSMMKEYDWVKDELVARGRLDVIKYCEYYRMLRHRGTFLRIDPELRREFCEQVLEDWNNKETEIVFDGLYKNWYEKLSEDAGALCDEYRIAAERIRTDFENAKSIVIYGAGIWGNAAFREVVNLGFYDKLKCFAVTNTGGQGSLGLVPVKAFEEVQNELKDSVVIMGVSVKADYYQEIYDRVMKFGCTNLIDAETICKYYYLV